MFLDPRGTAMREIPIFYVLVIFSCFGILANGYTVLSSTKLAEKQTELELMIMQIGRSIPSKEQKNSIFRAGYEKGLQEAEKDTIKAFEDGYHKATEDMECPATGALLPSVSKDKMLQPKK